MPLEPDRDALFVFFAEPEAAIPLSVALTSLLESSGGGDGYRIRVESTEQFPPTIRERFAAFESQYPGTRLSFGTAVDTTDRSSKVAKVRLDPHVLVVADLATYIESATHDDAVTVPPDAPEVLNFRELAPWQDVTAPGADAWWRFALLSPLHDEILAQHLGTAISAGIASKQAAGADIQTRADFIVRALTREIRKTTEAVNAMGEHTSELHRVRRQLGSIERVSNRAARAANEAVWGDVYRDTIQDSPWFTQRSMSPGRWALGYPALYVLYRLLEESKPTTILELGLGQSTRMIAQYAAAHTASHTVIEHDAAWVETFAANYEVPATTQLLTLDLITQPFEDDPGVLRYAGFAEAVNGRQFDLVLVDAPFGYQANAYARIDVLDLIPGSLAPSFAIVMDDVHRGGEKRSAERFEQEFAREGIEVVTTKYSGNKDLWLAVTPDLKFFTTL